MKMITYSHLYRHIQKYQVLFNYFCTYRATSYITVQFGKNSTVQFSHFINSFYKIINWTKVLLTI